MTQIGTIEYDAKVSNVAEAQANANDFAESNREMGESAEEAGGAAGFLAGSLSNTSDAQDDASKGADEADEDFTLLRGTVIGLAGTLGSLVLKFFAIGGVASSLSGVLSTLTGYLGALSLSGILGSVTSALSSFAGWLAAGSAGALALGAVIGAAIGLFGVWILEITGVLDWIGQLGEMLSVELPGWARDGLLAVIGATVGFLAVLGGFIVGFIEGGFDEAFARAGEVVDIFFGSFERTFNRVADWFIGLTKDIAGSFEQTWNSLAAWFGGLTDDLVKDFRQFKDDVVGFLIGIGDAVAGSVRTAFNSTVPSSVDVPSVTIGGGQVAGQDIPSTTIGGGYIDLPQLQTGGLVAEGGIARVHEGEAVLPEPIVQSAASSGGGGGGSEITVENISIEMSGEFDPSNVSRRDVESFADRIVDAIGDKTNRRSGVR